MAISNANAPKINHMNRAAQNVNMGTLLQQLQSGSSTLNTYIGGSGSHTVVAAEANACRVVITTGLAAVTGFMVQDQRSGSMIVNNVYAVSGSVAGTLDIRATSATGSLVQLGDVITWMAF